MARVRIEIGSRLRKLILGGFLLLIFGSINIYYLSSVGCDNETLHLDIQEDKETIAHLRATNQMLENEVAKMKENAKVSDVNETTTTNTKNNMSNKTDVAKPAVTPVSDFVRHDKVAIVSKIHGEHQWSLAEQSLCLLHYAYNQKVLYDIIIFTAEPVPENLIQDLQKTVAPSKLSVVLDNKGFHNEIADLSPKKLEAFKIFCNVTDTSNLTWFSYCSGHRLAYNWQAEFRGKRLWHHPALAEYKTMLWMDSDGFSTKPWEKDPVDYFIKNNGVIMFTHFQGRGRGLQKGIREGFIQQDHLLYEDFPSHRRA